ncbi:hypothetical protein FXF51_40455 [Nonomuraea sp. PA05]|nr:hypothetical protein FXF51_40455 [Nonomuraea sp. PA05]
MGRVWWWVHATSAREVLETFAEVEVIDSPQAVDRAEGRPYQALPRPFSTRHRKVWRGRLRRQVLGRPAWTGDVVGGHFRSLLPRWPGQLADLMGCVRRSRGSGFSERKKSP